jgi:GNAT superfamily N-acetyltransferase
MSSPIVTKFPEVILRQAVESDVPVITTLIQQLAAYEKLSHKFVATEELLRNNLFGEKKYAEVIIADYNDEPAGFALFFHNFSTFLGKPGIYLEDLFVKPELRGKGIGKTLLSYLARLGVERDCGRIEWAVLDWNKPAIDFYKSLGAVPMDDWILFRLTGDAIPDLASIFGRE